MCRSRDLGDGGGVGVYVVLLFSIIRLTLAVGWVQGGFGFLRVSQVCVGT